MDNEKAPQRSFFIHFMNATGGLHDPLLVRKVIEELKNWMPDYQTVENTSTRHTSVTEMRGWNNYRDYLLDNLDK